MRTWAWLRGPTTRRLVWPAAVVVATVLATAAGLVLAVLVHGRLPDREAAVPVLVGMIVAVVIGTLTAPAVRNWIRSSIPGLRRAPSDVGRRIAEAATQRLPLDEFLQRSAEALRRALDSPRVEIWIAAPAPERGSALTRTVALGSSGDPPVFDERDRAVVERISVAGEGWAQRWLPKLLAPVDPHDARRAPMRVAAITDLGEFLGLVVVGRRHGAAGYEFAEDDALASACRLLAAVLRNRQLTVALEASLADLQHTNAELQASRTRIVTAADAERRRIERDLHDGAQQHLLALALSVGLVRQMVEEKESPEEIDSMLEQIGDDVRAAVTQVRQLAQGIYPALLMDGGLEPALRAVASRSPQRVTVEAEGVRRHPANLEAAVYFCCLEALQNAAKHAPGADVAVCLREQAGNLTATVSDTGPGFDASSATAGMGRTTMADRVGALGGTVRWVSSPEGTSVVVEVPVADHPVAGDLPGTAWLGTR